MAKAALGRRRGTRGKKGGLLSSQNGLFTAIIAAMGLICCGLVGGIVLGTLLYSSAPETTKAKVENAKNAMELKMESMNSNLRKGINRFTPGHEDRNAANNGSGVGSVGNQELQHQELRTGGGEDILNVDTKTSDAQTRKVHYVEHNPSVGTKGPFPYQGAVVSETHDFADFTAPGGSRYGEYKWGDSPYTYEKGQSDEVARTRRFHVKKAMQHAWKAYETYAMGMDEVKPISLQGQNNWGGMGTTLVDSLDTLYLMGMTDELDRAREWVKSSLSHDRPKQVSVFETTIRSLGGLLSIYDWTQDSVYLNHAHDLGKRLFKAYEGNGGIPKGQVNLQTGHSNNMGWTGYNTLVAEAGTLQIEFRALARFTGERDFKTKTEHTFELLRDMNPPNGLYPYYISQGDGPRHGNLKKDKNGEEIPTFGNDKITFGAMADSFYEYMLKIWLQGGKTESWYREMYDKAIQGMHDELLQISSPSGLVFLADKNNGKLNTKMDHLVCFMGGLLALGAYTDPQGLDSERAQRDLKAGKALTYTCYQMYARMETGISPEFVQFREGIDFEAGRNAPHYLLRPEAIESMFILYHLTGDPIYREWGWEMFSAIERYCRTDGGYGGLRDVRKTFGTPDDKMESFFLAETLKYSYLLFDPETPIDLLNKHVFNTEAHPMRIFPQLDADGMPDLLQ